MSFSWKVLIRETLLMAWVRLQHLDMYKLYVLYQQVNATADLKMSSLTWLKQTSVAWLRTEHLETYSG